MGEQRASDGDQRTPVATGSGASRALAGIDAAYMVNAAWNALTYVGHPDLGLDLVSLGLIWTCASCGIRRGARR